MDIQLCLIMEHVSLRCVIKDKQSGHMIVNILMTKNRMFPLEVSTVEDFALVAGEQNKSKLWHL